MATLKIWLIDWQFQPMMFGMLSLRASVALLTALNNIEVHKAQITLPADLFIPTIFNFLNI